MIENHHDKWFSMSPWNAFFTIIPLFPTFFSLKNSMTNSTDTTAEWYVLRVTYQRELSTKEYLDKLNIENFVPIRVVRRRNSKGQFFRAWRSRRAQLYFHPFDARGHRRAENL